MRAYPGTYAALGCGMIGGYAQNQLDRSPAEWPSSQAAAQALARRCQGCHTGARQLPATVVDEIVGPPWQDLSPDDPRRRYSRHLLYNLTRPEKSTLLLAPLAPAAGGLGRCRVLASAPADDVAGATSAPAEVFRDQADPDYQLMLAAITAAQQKLDEIKRFDMPGFRPRPEWVREMKRYGVLPPATDAADAIDPYAVERRYWEALWYAPAADPG